MLEIGISYFKITKKNLHYVPRGLVPFHTSFIFIQKKTWAPKFYTFWSKLIAPNSIKNLFCKDYRCLFLLLLL